MKKSTPILSGLACLLFASASYSQDFDTSIPMRMGNASTFYIKAQIADLNEMDFMVDTGSGYMTINEQTLARLKKNHQAKYQRDLSGVLANGTSIKVPVYQLTRFNIGGDCQLSNVEAAVFPGTTRQIIGLNALKKAGPFIFSFNPPHLMLSHCPSQEQAQQKTETDDLTSG
jgi:predicted aspartyl protease